MTNSTIAFRQWKAVTLDNRIELVKKFVCSVLSDKEILKPQIAGEIGKSYKNIDEEFERVKEIADKFIESGRHALKPQIIEEHADVVSILL